MIRDASSVCLSLNLRAHRGIAGPNCRLRKIHIGKPPILLGENHRSVEPPHLVDPFDDVVILDSADTLRFYALVELLLSFRRPTGAGPVFDVEYAQRFAQDDFTHAGMMSGITEQRINVHGPNREFAVASHIEPVLAGQ